MGYVTVLSLLHLKAETYAFGHTSEYRGGYSLKMARQMIQQTIQTMTDETSENVDTDVEQIDTTPRSPEAIVQTMAHLATIEDISFDEYVEAFQAWANGAAIATELGEQGELSNERKVELIESARER